MRHARLAAALSAMLGTLGLGAAAEAAPLAVAVTAGVNANCIFDVDCTVFVNDTSASIVTTGGAVQSRRFPVGEPGTVGEGMHAYVYRVDLRNAVGILAIECVRTIEIPFGGIESFDYDGDGFVEQLWESNTGLGNVSIASAEQLDDTLRITFAGSGVCQGAFAGGGDSSFFFGLASRHDDTHADGALSFNLTRAGEAVDLRVPDRPTTPVMEDYAFVWADDESASSYTPPAYYSYNRTGGTNTVTRSGVGQYRVHFEGMDTLWNVHGNAQVTAYGDFISDAHCSTTGWGADYIDVICFDDSGWRRDTPFTALLAKPMPIRDGVAYVRGDQPTAASYQPASANVQNPGGGTTQITRLGTGSYLVRFNGFETAVSSAPGSGGNVQVTGMDPAGGRCVVYGWSHVSADVQVQCRSIGGAPLDAEFSLLWLLPDERFDRDVAYAWSNTASSPSYEPDPRYATNPGQGGVYGTRNVPGYYGIDFDGLAAVSGPTGGHVQVTPYGDDGTRCEISGWGSETVTVHCFGPTGTATDTRFSVLRLQPTPVPEPMLGVGLLVGGGALAARSARRRLRLGR